MMECPIQKVNPSDSENHLVKVFLENDLQKEWIRDHFYEELLNDKSIYEL